MYVTLNLNNTVSFPSGDDFQVPTSSSAPRTYFLFSPCVCLQLGFWPSRSAFHKNVKCIQYTDVTHIAQSIRVTQCLRLATVTTFVRIIISPFLTVCIFFCYLSTTPTLFARNESRYFRYYHRKSVRKITKAPLATFEMPVKLRKTAPVLHHNTQQMKKKPRRGTTGTRD